MMCSCCAAEGQCRHSVCLTGTCFIRTDQLDGETDWKMRVAVPQCQTLEEDGVSVSGAWEGKGPGGWEGRGLECEGKVWSV